VSDRDPVVTAVRTLWKWFYTGVWQDYKHRHLSTISWYSALYRPSVYSNILKL